MNNFLLSLFILAELTGFSVPQIIEDDLYLVPTYSADNEYSFGMGKIKSDLPTIKEATPPRPKGLNAGPEDIQAKAAVVMDAKTKEVLWQKNQTASLPIASMTKLMTVLVFAENNPGWDAKHKMTSGENSLIGAKLQIDSDQELNMLDLLRVTLIGSANNTAMALSHSIGMNDEQFKKAMNKKAEQLGLQNSHFVEPTGLDENNKSSPQDMAIILGEVISHKELKEAMAMKEHKMLIPPDNHEHTVKSTVKIMLDEEVNVIGGKTGFTYEAGYCLASIAKNAQGNEIITVVMGLPDEVSRDAESKELIQWAFDNYEWKK
ncbi:MAG: serine hydrolase [Patescibacteria group bacterium]|jgi:D-alanyl-D-alanine carboxypeptidase (penicillin-binding protein 5/6)